MTVKLKVDDGFLNTDTTAGVNSRGQLCTSPGEGTLPEQGSLSIYRYYNSLLGSTGADSGVTDMTVDGSVTPQEFCISSHNDYDLHITALILILAGTKNSVVHSNFGGITAIGTGWDLIMTEGGLNTNLITRATTNGEVIAQSGLGHAFGNAATSFVVTDWNGTDDALSVVIPLHDFIPHGIRIGRGTTDKLRSIVNDDLTGAAFTEFTVRAIGYRHYP